VPIDFLNPCPDYGMECVKDPDAGMFEPGYCTAECGNDECPEPFICLADGQCGCEDGPQPSECPGGECERGADCEAIGFPEESACVTQGNYCTMPCSSDGDCRDMFGSQWECSRFGSQGQFCTCQQ